MPYCSIESEDKNRLFAFINWLYQEVKRSGGDGDALWYSSLFDIKDILILVEDYNEKLKYKWKVDFDEKRKLIVWWENQESILITNDKKIYKAAPNWLQCLLKY